MGLDNPCTQAGRTVVCYVQARGIFHDAVCHKGDNTREMGPSEVVSRTLVEPLVVNGSFCIYFTVQYCSGTIHSRRPRQWEAKKINFWASKLLTTTARMFASAQQETMIGWWSSSSSSPSVSPSRNLISAILGADKFRDSFSLCPLTDLFSIVY